MGADVALLTVLMESMYSLLAPVFSLFIHVSINPHMAALDIASVIGTWVAAFVAIIALVGIIGPVLIWRASRTERHLAIAAIDDDNNTFKSRGIHAGPGIWLLQRMRTPILNIAPASLEESISLSLDTVKEPISTTNWVQFGILLQAYGVRYRTGDRIEIRNSKTHLPVHKFWILLFGLKGRYSKRRDLARLRSGMNSVRFSATWEPRRHFHSRRSSSIEVVSSDSDDNIGVRTILEPLFGLTGNIKGHLLAGDENVTVLKFQLAPLKDLRKLTPDDLPCKELFLLSVGCIRLHSGGYCSLLESEVAADNESSEYSDDSDHHVTGIRVPRVSRRMPTKPSRTKTPRYDRERYHAGLDAYELVLADEFDAAFVEKAKTFDADREQLKVLSRVKYSRPLSADLEAYKGMTYVPAESPWIRLSSEESHQEEAFIARADAQEMAYSLLQILWHPESYLLGSSKHAIGKRLLTNSASWFPRVAERISKGIHSVGLGNAERTRLLEVLEPANRKAEKATVDRASTTAMYKLDQVLCELGQRDDKVIIDRMVGILMLTNQEFQELLYQSLRHLQETSLSVVQVDLRAATIKIPSAFGFMQTFVLDLDRMYPSQDRSHDTQSVPYSAVVLAALKGCLRSYMLQQCFDSGPLLQMIDRCSDVVLLE